MQLKASAPGSLMLLGEYAVLYGKQALVCAVDKRITVTLTPRQDETIIINSPKLGEYQTELKNLQIEKPYQFVLGVFKHYEMRIKRGFDIDIVSDFSHEVGLGSSAAVTVATLAALLTWMGIRMSPLDLIRQGRNVIKLVQGVGSGADIAASVYGGVIGYQAQPLSAEKFAVSHPLVALYAGFKTPTVTAIKKVQDYFATNNALFRQLQVGIGQCAVEGMHYLRKKDWKSFGKIMNIQQGLMDSLGVNTPLLQEMIEHLREQTNIMGAKISGSGMGDCVIGLGELSDNFQIPKKTKGIELIPVEMSLQGVHCEKI